MGAITDSARHPKTSALVVLRCAAVLTPASKPPSRWYFFSAVVAAGIGGIGGGIIHHLQSLLLTPMPSPPQLRTTVSESRAVKIEASTVCTLKLRISAVFQNTRILTQPVLLF